MYIITRLLNGRKEWYSSDGSRNFWQFRGSYWENIFSEKYFVKYLDKAEGYKELYVKVVPNYLTNAFYEVEEYNNMSDHAMWVITKTPKSKAKKDIVSDMDTAVGKEYLKKNRSGNYFEKGFDGEHTRKFTDKNKADVMAQQVRCRTINSVYDIKVEPVS